MKLVKKEGVILKNENVTIESMGITSDRVLFITDGSAPFYDSGCLVESAYIIK